MSLLAASRAEAGSTLRLAAPIIIGQVSQMLMGVTDSVMIGRTGTVPLAASAFGGNVFSIFYVLGIGLMIPVAILVARARGAERPEEAGEYLRHGLALAVLCGLAETLVMALVGTQLHRFGQPAEVMAVVMPFYLLIASSITPVLIYLVLRQFAEAMGRPWVPMFIMLAGVGLNALLNWILIYGKLGVPALGLTGAALSTLISRSIGAGVIFLWLRLDPVVRPAWPRRWLGGWSRQRFGDLMHLGLPAGAMLTFESSAFVVSCVMIGWLGAVPLAAHQIAISCASLAFMFPLGLGMAAGMRVSHAVGADERERLRPIAFGAFGLGWMITLGFGIGFALGGRSIATWFVADPAVISLASQLLIVAGVFQMVDGTQVIGASVLRAVADVRVPMAITLAAYWGMALPVGYLLGVRGPLGAVGVWIGIASGLAVAALLLPWRFVRLTRRS
jgi:MATE family multidrug resistance protein